MTLYPEAMHIDLHTHNLIENPDIIQVLNCDPTDASGVCSVQQPANNRYFSIGVHPWNAHLWSLEFAQKIQSELATGKAIMVGEIGLDARCGVSIEIQRTAFKAQLELASSYAVPVLLHAVRVTTEMIQIKKAFPAIPTWIIHGFRGKPEIAKQFLSAGFYLSFGANFNAEAFKICPMDRVFIESDNSNILLAESYSRVAEALNLDVQTVEGQIHRNFINVFSLA